MKVLLVMLLAVVLGGCCASGSARCYVARAHTALEAGDPIAIKAIGAACRPKVSLCTGDPGKCEAFVKCRAALEGYKASRKLAGQALVDVNRILAEMGVK